jgi:DNA-binding response OmpR family regulator
MGTPLRVLILEDDDADSGLVVAELRRSGFDLHWKQATDEQEFLGCLSETWDLVLADFSLPQYSALQALEAPEKRISDTTDRSDRIGG